MRAPRIGEPPLRVAYSMMQGVILRVRVRLLVFTDSPHKKPLLLARQQHGHVDCPNACQTVVSRKARLSGVLKTAGTAAVSAGACLGTPELPRLTCKRLHATPTGVQSLPLSYTDCLQGSDARTPRETGSD